MSQLAEFVSNHLFLSLAFLAVFFIYLSIIIGEKTQVFKNVDTNQFTQLVNHQNAVVIDTRSKEDFAKGHIVNAINIPTSELVSNAKKVDSFKGKAVIAYCANGITSKAVCRHLTKSGIEHVFNLSGGINGWIGEKLPIVRN
ncbi:MAG: rhodanese-like domain-containing protein [Gammaproteobacteria bacterium]|jgi:rhodanese-related sulfurtransferase|nr:rhodanese-like domain-containing protein [Xanthomonadales bacterium]